MARKRKTSFFKDIANHALLQVLVSMSRDGLVQLQYGEFPAFQLYPSKDASLGELQTDLPCMLGKTMAEKASMSTEVVDRLNKVWVNSPFGSIQSRGGFVYFKLHKGIELK